MNIIDITFKSLEKNITDKQDRELLINLLNENWFSIECLNDLTMLAINQYVIKVQTLNELKLVNNDINKASESGIKFFNHEEIKEDNQENKIIKTIKNIFGGLKMKKLVSVLSILCVLLIGTMTMSYGAERQIEGKLTSIYWNEETMLTELYFSTVDENGWIIEVNSDKMNDDCTVNMISKLYGTDRTCIVHFEDMDNDNIYDDEFKGVEYDSINNIE